MKQSTSDLMIRDGNISIRNIGKESITGVNETAQTIPPTLKKQELKSRLIGQVIRFVKEKLYYEFIRDEID